MRQLTSCALGRLAAALLIMSLSGAGGLLPRAEAAEHHCQCSLMGKGGRHQCECPICRLAALRAASNDASAPACHRAAALRALEEEVARPKNCGGPVLSTGCDDSHRYLGGSSGIEQFVLPSTIVLRHVPTVERRGEPLRAPSPAVVLPELPPPRASSGARS
jgi:hypothetical protein